MTHFAVIVLTEQTDDIEAAVTRLLAPYDENNEWFRDGSRWDWWVIGGRFTGALTNYDPRTNPDNWETCRYCKDGITDQATADRYPAYREHVGETCIQCNGTGKTLRFDFAAYDGDVQPVSALDLNRMEYVPSVIVTPDGEWHEQARFGWFGTTMGEEKPESDWRAEFERHLAANPNATAVLVDCHV